MFESDMTTYIDELRVSIDGAAIPFRLYSVGGTKNLALGPVNTYACDISAFAGESNVTLTFEKLIHDPTNPIDTGIVDLDAIQFSSIVVPEPSSLLLLAIAFVSVAAYWWRFRARAS
jgi:hypothetical protein